mgnify:CR=1 FL=1
MNIAVLLSGGVDSSVAVHLLCEQGYRPSLFYIKIGRDDADYMTALRKRIWRWLLPLPVAMDCHWK